ncbi:MAG: PEP-CTERM sorting domain-containing protein [Candidatus Omnitrophica bacterium]|nr:PEP-CTERM sorting domain-containing protein [Candidatus Omnitrophota bacterium]
MKKVFFTFAIMLFVSMSGQVASAIDWSLLPNLVQNPGGESGDTSSWSVTGPWYATSSQAQSTGTVNPHSGQYFFSSANSPSASAVMTQDVDISSFASIVDAGIAQFDVGFWYQTELFQSVYDTVVGKISFYDGTNSLLDSSETGELFSTVWTLEDYIDYVPVGTRSIELSFTGILHGGSYINAFVDDSYLKIGSDPIVPEPATLLLLGSGLLGLVGIRKKR